MSKEEILDYFKDIDAMYNDCTKHDTLKHMLDELLGSCEVSEYDKDHIWYKGSQYISLRRFLEVKAGIEDKVSRIVNDHPLDGYEDGQLILKTIQDLPPVTPTDDKCQECEKDWTKCARCPVMMGRRIGK